MKTACGIRVFRHLQLLLLGFLVLLPSYAQDNKPADTPQAFRTGGTAILIPSPASDLVEIGPDLRVLLEPLVPDNNRLLAAFLSREDLSELQKGAKKGLSRYGLVEVPRRAEFADVDAGAFKEVTGSVSEQMNTPAFDTAAKTETEAINRKIAALGADGKISIEKPVQLGPIFSKPNAFGYATLLPIVLDGQTTNMVGGTIILRVKNRLVFAYLLTQYKDKDSAAWVSRQSESWADAVLKANQQ